MKSSVIATFKVEGVHRWPNCNIDEVSYLTNLHRHLFTFKITVLVFHDDRDLEFIQFGHRVQRHLAERFYCDNLKLLNFASLSCEQLCAEVLNSFAEVVAVEAWEDDENGARVER